MSDDIEKLISEQNEAHDFLLKITKWAKEKIEIKLKEYEIKYPARVAYPLAVLPVQTQELNP